MKSLKTFLSLISGLALITFLYKLFSAKSAEDSSSFPQAAEKAAVVEEVSQFKEEIKKLEQASYTDEEIVKKFNQ